MRNEESRGNDKNQNQIEWAFGKGEKPCEKKIINKFLTDTGVERVVI